jgi:hypothetical protein
MKSDLYMCISNGKLRRNYWSKEQPTATIPFTTFNSFGLTDLFNFFFITRVAKTQGWT